MRRLLTLLAILACTWMATGDRHNQAREWAGAIQNAIKDLSDNYLRPSIMQSLYDNQAVGVAAKTPWAILESLAGAVGRKVVEKETVVTNLATRVEAESTHPTAGGWGFSCCTGWRVQADERFFQAVNFDDGCYTTPVNELDGNMRNAILIGGGLTSTFVSNMQTATSLKWQYFASETGVHRLYPGVLWPRECSMTDSYVATCETDCDGACKAEAPDCSGACSSFEPRSSGWYNDGLAGANWDFVFLIDAARMTPDALASTSGAIVDTLNAHPDAFVDVIAMTDSGLALSFPTSVDDIVEDCATLGSPPGRPSRDQLSAWLHDLKSGGDSNYEQGLTTAFARIKRRSTQSTLMIMIGADAPTLGKTTPKLLSLFTADLASQLPADRRLKVMAYRLNFVTANTALDAVSIALGAGPATVTDVPTLRILISTYYRYSSAGMTPDIVWTKPRCDADGLGTVIQVVRRVDNAVGPVGVVGTTVPVQELFETVFDVRGGDSYAFVIDERGYAILHPNLARPDALNRHPALNDASWLEGVEEWSVVRNAILADLSVGNGTGNLNLTVTHPEERGSPSTEGVATVQSYVQYYWKRVEGSRYIIVYAVVSDLTTPVVVARGAARVLNPDYYHRIDLIPGNSGAIKTAKDTPNRANMWVTMTHSTYKLAPRAFRPAYTYLEFEETIASSQSISDLVNGLPSDTLIGDAALSDVFLTSNMEARWKETDDNPIIVSRYVGTQSGVHRTYPGHQVYSKRFDPADRPWFQRAASSPGTLMVSTPYFDPNGGGQVVTLSTSVGRSDASPGTVEAVLALDMAYNDFYTKIASVTGCPPLGVKDSALRCLLIDTSALLVAHPNFALDKNQWDSIEQLRAQFEGVFLGAREPLLANELLVEHELYDFYRCIDYQAHTVQSFYTANSSSPTSQLDVAGSLTTCGFGTTVDTSGTYYVIGLANTNLALVVMDNYQASNGQCGCSCPCQTTAIPQPLACASACTCPADFACDSSNASLAMFEDLSRLPACFVPYSVYRKVPVDDLLWLIPVVIGSVAIVGGAATSAYVYYKKSRSGVSFYYYVISILLHAPIHYLARLGMFRIRRYARYFPRSWEELARFRLRRRTGTQPLRNTGPF